MNGLRKKTTAAGVILLCFVFLGYAPVLVQASLTHYVNKHKMIKVSREQEKRLERYSYLINYFCSFAYFQLHHKVNPDFIRALILAESNAEPGARSNKDARGLTQIIYTTGKQAATALAQKPIHFRYVSRKTLENLRPADLG